MHAYAEHLREHYAQLETDELLSLHRGGLTDVACETLEAELSKRNVAIPVRPDPTENMSQPEGFFSGHWNGTKPLWSAWWLLGVIGIPLMLCAAFLVSAIAFSDPAGNRIAKEQMSLFLITAVGLFTPYFVFVCVSVWRCANNTEWKWCGPLARIGVGLWVLQCATIVIRSV